MKELTQVRDAVMTALDDAGLRTMATFPAGRAKQFVRGSISSTKPSPPPSSRTRTQSPTRGLVPSLRNFPRARHCRTCPPIFT